VHVAGKVDPLDDIDVINLELALADLAQIEKRVERIKKGARRRGRDRGGRWCMRGDGGLLNGSCLGQAPLLGLVRVDSVWCALKRVGRECLARLFLGAPTSVRCSSSPSPPSPPPCPAPTHTPSPSGRSKSKEEQDRNDTEMAALDKVVAVINAGKGARDAVLTKDEWAAARAGLSTPACSAGACRAVPSCACGRRRRLPDAAHPGCSPPHTWRVAAALLPPPPLVFDSRRPPPAGP
jgi:hypothetical protein